jgi:hypothetical protein
MPGPGQARVSSASDEQTNDFPVATPFQQPSAGLGIHVHSMGPGRTARPSEQARIW